jgi:hypothetical protein
MMMNQQPTKSQRTIRPISTWDTWKSLPIQVEHIPDATVPIGADLDLRQK